VCGRKREDKPIFRLTQFGVYACPCGHRFIDPSLSGDSMMEIYQSSEALAQINPALEFYYEYDGLDEQSRTGRDYGILMHYLESMTGGRSLLEVGCGRGAFLKFARKRGWRVSGIDSSRQNTEELQREGILAECADFSGYDSSVRYDVVVLYDLIEHPQDPVSFVRTCVRLLKPGGLLAFSSPHDPNLITVLGGILYGITGGKLKSPLEKFYILEHTSYFSKKSFHALAEREGLRIEKTWRGESDLRRFRFPVLTRWTLYILFALARILRLQNRITVIARKPVMPEGEGHG